MRIDSMPDFGREKGPQKPQSVGQKIAKYTLKTHEIIGNVITRTNGVVVITAVTIAGIITVAATMASVVLAATSTLGMIPPPAPRKVRKKRRAH